MKVVVSTQSHAQHRTSEQRSVSKGGKVYSCFPLEARGSRANKRQESICLLALALLVPHLLFDMTWAGEK